jgi:ferritin
MHWLTKLLLTKTIQQHEEEKLFKGILDKIELVGDDGHALFFVDKDLAEMAKSGSESIMTNPEA